MIARISISSIPGLLPPEFGRRPFGISPGAVAGETAGGGVFEATPVVGISPASAETERVHVKATVNMNRFIGVTPYLRKNHVKLFASIKIRPILHMFLQVWPERFNITSQFALLRFPKASTLMRTSPKLETAHFTANEEASLRCRNALELRDCGDYDGAREAMALLWAGDRQPAKNRRTALFRRSGSPVVRRNSHRLAWQPERGERGRRLRQRLDHREYPALRGSSEIQ